MPVPIAACSGSKANTARQLPAGNPSAIVSGAGTTAANGTYTERGESNGFPYYNLIGQPSNDQASSIYHPGDQFVITAADTSTLYIQTTGSVGFPWEDTWDVVDGDLPAPTVSEG